MSQESDTPRTDALCHEDNVLRIEDAVALCRQLERELSTERETLRWCMKERERVSALSEIALKWQPIETAPMDGTTVLLLVPTLYGKWNKEIPVAGRWEEREPASSGFWIIFNADESVQRVEAIAWMPLPRYRQETHK